MRPLRSLAWLELKLFLREPLTLVFSLALPVIMLYVLGGVFGNDPDIDGVEFGGFGPMDFYVPAYVGLVTASMGLIGLPVHLASYRERGVLRRFRASGVPATAVFGSQVVKTFVVATIGAVLVVALGQVSFDVSAPEDVAGVVAAFVLAVMAFAAIGLLLGVLLPTARAAQGAGVLLWFVMLIVAGAGPPPELLTEPLQRLADLTPLKHVVVALQDPWLGRGWNGEELALVAAFFVVAGALALGLFRREAQGRQ